MAARAVPFALAALLAVAAGCSDDAATTAPTRPTGEAPPATTAPPPTEPAAGPTVVARNPYRNPVLDADFPDPSVLRAPDGWYYAYATQGGDGVDYANIQVARSRDLVRWERLADALPEKPAWAADTHFWAPSAVRRDDGRYVLFFAAAPSDAFDPDDPPLCLALATSDSPQGPFEPAPEPMHCGSGSDIDLHVFADPADGRLIGTWGAGGNIVARPVADDLSGFEPDAPEVLLLQGWTSPVHRPYEHGIEGPFIVHRDGWYYLWYSGDRCCENPPHYAAMVARSRDVLGPYRRLPPRRKGGGAVVLGDGERFLGPGHNSVVRDARGRDWIVYHAVDSRRPLLGGGGIRRVLLIDPIAYRDGWPVVDGPSQGRRLGPWTRRPAQGPG
jgi:arabinan endo-1,5-alpha-L-arabinosidase